MKEQTENDSHDLCVVWMLFSLIFLGNGKLEILHMEQCRHELKNLV